MVTEEPTPVKAKPRVAILFGGRSSEHAVSCVTAAGVMGAIDTNKYEVIPIGIAKSGQWVLASGDTSQWSLSSRSLPEVAASGQTVTLAEVGGEHQLIVTEPNAVPGSWAPLTSCSHCCMARGVRTEQSRASWSCPTRAT